MTVNFELESISNLFSLSGVENAQKIDVVKRSAAHNNQIDLEESAKDFHQRHKPDKSSFLISFEFSEPVHTSTQQVTNVQHEHYLVVGVRQIFAVIWGELQGLIHCVFHKLFEYLVLLPGNVGVSSCDKQLRNEQRNMHN